MRMQRPFFPTAICCRLKTFQTTLTSSPNYFSLGPSWNVGIIPLSSQSWRNSHPGACPWVQEPHSGVQKQWVSTTRCEPSLPAQINCLGEQTTLPVTWRAPTAPQEEGPLPLHGLMSMICLWAPEQAQFGCGMRRNAKPLSLQGKWCLHCCPPALRCLCATSAPPAKAGTPAPGLLWHFVVLGHLPPSPALACHSISLPQ